MFKLFAIFITLIFLVIVASAVEIGVNPSSEISGVVIPPQPPEPVFNNNTGAVNSSQFAEIWLATECQNGECDNVVDITPYLGTLFANLTGDTFTGEVIINRGAVSRWLTGQTSGTPVFRCGTDLFGVVSCSSANNQPLYLGSDDVNQRMVFADTSTTGEMSFVANQLHGYYVGNLFAETLRYRINRTGNAHFQDVYFGGVNVFGLDNVANTTGGILSVVQHNHDPNSPFMGEAIPHDWQEPSRSFGTVYTNNRNRSIEVKITGASSVSSASADVAYMEGFTTNSSGDFTRVASEGITDITSDVDTSLGERHYMGFVVDPDEDYQVNVTVSGSGSLSMLEWIEVDE